MNKQTDNRESTQTNFYLRMCCTKRDNENYMINVQSLSEYRVPYKIVFPEKPSELKQVDYMLLGVDRMDIGPLPLEDIIKHLRRLNENDKDNPHFENNEQAILDIENDLQHLYSQIEIVVEATENKQVGERCSYNIQYSPKFNRVHLDSDIAKLREQLSESKKQVRDLEEKNRTLQKKATEADILKKRYNQIEQQFSKYKQEAERNQDIPIEQDIFESDDNLLDSFQEHLDVLYEHKLAEAASPNEEVPDDVSRVWFFIELWKVKVEEPLKSLLSEFQEQMKRISPELENYSFEKPDLGEKPNLGQGDFAALKEYLSLYQQKKQSLQDTPFDELPIQPEKRRRLQRAACRFVDRIYECGGATKHKIEVFLSLVGLGELFIKVGYTPFYEVFHETVDRRREPSLARGTIVEVIQRGFFDRTTGEIVRKASVITAE